METVIESTAKGISAADWKYIELKGYMFTGKNCYIWGPEGVKLKLPEGITCMNCRGMVYYDKCANDECYNFYMYCNYKHIAKEGILDDMFWELLYRTNPHLKEEK